MSNQLTINGLPVTPLPTHKTNPDYHTDKQQVFIVGSKGIPAAYGGFETFVEMLTRLQTDDSIRYHVSRLGKDTRRYEHNGAKCFNVNVPDIGPAKAIYYDIAALKRCIAYCKARPQIKHPIFYVLACRIGPFIGHLANEIHALGGALYVNPDGHEWKRAKWSAPVRRYWKYSEQLMVKHADLLICDSKNIEAYIRSDYRKYSPRTTFIAYGADPRKSKLADNDPQLLDWYAKKGLKAKEYYLVVGRFVPENNFETMIKEFMKSGSKKNFAIITTSNDEFLKKLEEKLHFKNDPRIKFVGTVYDTELLKKIREQAYGYFHGHEVGGTNPSLLEALSSTDLNLLLDVGFNREVAEDAALYWSKRQGSLATIISTADSLSARKINELGIKAKRRITEHYSWKKIVGDYESLFLIDD
ncbi:beta 1-4 rhamnosyltransferase Cps2T [Lactiplantibacillus xiangfangensis]|uniref:beta 1-4 rhamnosyltransferase Cps2T n=1 Tax=Lactiplantibacillus xiangfangensis TaxID=942150 RepID=UPI0003438A2C|nr:rhamnosyltransferase [Lacticaseibacillus paracasei subsp. paracasei Lpp227]